MAMQLRTYQNGGHLFTYCDDEIIIPKSATDSMLAMIDEWLQHFPYEPTYVQQKFNVPCLMVRFDGVIDQDRTFRPYELQPSGAGVGYASLVSEKFRMIRDRYVREKWPPFKLLQGVVREIDDDLWLDSLTLDEAIASTDLLQMRYPLRPLYKAIAEKLIARSVKPVRTMSTKEYGEKLGWWKKMHFNDAALLPWDSGFALKPLIGWGSADIMIWNPVGRPGGSATRSQILKVFEKRRVMHLQPFIPPMQRELDGKKYNVIIRPVFGYDPQNKKWRAWGGTWNGRPAPQLRIHGSSDMIAGPLTLEE